MSDNSDMSDAEFGRHLLAHPKASREPSRDPGPHPGWLRDRAEVAETRARLLEEELHRARRWALHLKGVIDVMRKHIDDASEAMSEAKAASHETGQDQPQ